MTITLGWWAIPTAATIGTVLWNHHQQRKSRGGYMSGDPFASVAAVVVILAAWLVYFVARSLGLPA